MASSFPKKSAIAAAAGAIALTAGGQAMAGSYVSVGYGHGYYGGYHHYAGYHGGYGRHYRHHRRHRHGHGAGKGAAIALGVIGGAIILNELAEDRARQRYYEDRYYDRYDRYDRYSRRAEPFDRGHAGEERLPEESYGGAGEDASLDERLDGKFDGGPEPIRISSHAAYETCISHARAALADRDFMLAAPASPDTADDVGRGWKMTANVTAQSRSGESWTRAMYCEADESRVYLLELI